MIGSRQCFPTDDRIGRGTAATTGIATGYTVIVGVISAFELLPAESVLGSRLVPAREWTGW